MATDKRFVSSLVFLALPIAVQMLLQSFLAMADVVMVAPLGETAIAAVGLAAKIHFLLLVLMSGFAAGASILIAQFSGAKDFVRCQRTLAVAMVVGISFILPIMLLCGFAAPIWIRWITPDPQIAGLSAQFLVITAPVILLTQIIVIFESALRSLGQTAMPLLAGAIAAIINVALNYGLITGNWGMPALGIAGAAWATLAARAIQLVLVVGWVYAKQHGLALTAQQWLMGFNRDSIARYLGFALPLVANYGMWALGNSAYHIITGYAGAEALAVMGMVVPIESLFFALFIGLANASAVFIGRALGGNDPQQAWRLQKFFDRLTFILVVSLALLLWSARSLILSVFTPLSAPTASLLLQVVAVFCALVWLKAFNLMRIVGVLRAGGDNKFCLLTDVTVMWFFGLPIYAAAVFFGHFSFVTIYALIFVEEILKFIPVIMRIKSRKWMNNLALNSRFSADISTRPQG